MPDSEISPEDHPGKRLRALRTGLLIAGSAFFGGLAVALWNRKSLTRLRQPVEDRDPPSAEPDADDT